jgi:hypothetical protein
VIFVRLFLVILFIPAFIVIARSIGSRSKAARTLLLFLLPALFGYSIVFPETWQLMADFLNVDRGSDLLLYVTVLTLITYIGYSFSKFRYLEKRIVVLVREIALMRGVEEPNP